MTRSEIHELTEAEFLATLPGDCCSTYDADEYALEFWDYVDSIPRLSLSPHPLQPKAVRYVYATTDEKYEHVLIQTDTQHVYLIIVEDLVNDTIYGHRLIDLRNCPEVWSLTERDDCISRSHADQSWQGWDCPLDVACAMWRQIHTLVEHEFRSLFDRLYRIQNGITCLWQLGGATNDYLRRNPDAITVPVAMPRRLLASNYVDARVIGLKLLNRCTVDDDEIVDGIVRALNRNDGYESCGGLCELDNLLHNRCSRGKGLDASRIGQLLTALEPLVDDGLEEHGSVSHVAARLRDFE